MRFAAVKSSNLMTAAQGVSNLIRPGEPGAAKNENAKRFRRFLCEQRCRSCGQGKGATSRSRKFDKFTTRREFIKLSAAAGGAFALTTRSTTLLAEKSAKPLRILILGGTGFTGPYQIRYALSRGHKVTTFNRGKTHPG